ncbi:6-phospho-alpha-glucosidase [Eubacterium multiforme]|uniref:Maltose-6'-phosphate glucosidase n=1 Tax=Eubacterium multiforme TaxID=83339 RepID=A0ABT9UXN0_9FIRM|nr:6-phospho-alpha-glucosidase [Eubacterium multiforme]MDQ0151079.1 maltose-6'-phosphate glucosidase [Eubacterium multiforme]
MGNKIVIVGGGSTHTPGIVEVLKNRAEDLELEELVLYDNNEERNRLLGEFTKIYYRDNNSKVNVSYTTNIEEAFENADFLYVQIRPGLNNQREIDEKICLKHGVVGQETCGLGGFSFALRVIPQMLKIVEVAQRVCPDAWILNYTNPEAIISEAIYRKFPKAKCLCICDMPIIIEKSIADYLKIPREDLTFKYFGLNHFGWWTNIFDKEGHDILPEIRERVLSGELTALNQTNEEAVGDNYWNKTFKNIIKAFKMYPKYFPNCYLQYYYFADEMVESDDINFTRGSYVLSTREITVFEECKKVIEEGTAKNSKLINGVHGNYIVDITNAIIHDTKERFIVNIKNCGAIGNFNPEAVVEVPCYIGAMGVEPVSVGNIPTFHRSMMEMQKGYEILTVETALTGSYNIAMEAILLNKTIPSYRVGKALLDELLEANKDYWPDLK